MRTYTWHRDSHGLFDYESRNISMNHIKCNYSSKRSLKFNIHKALLYRFDNEIVFEEKRPYDRVPAEAASVILEKDGNYWLYHKGTVDDYEEERQAPASKAWLIVKYTQNESSQVLNKGYKIRIGDTIKFGRVRFKVIMLSNFYDGTLIYQPMDIHNKNKKKLIKKVSKQ